MTPRRIRYGRCGFFVIAYGVSFPPPASDAPVPSFRTFLPARFSMKYYPLQQHRSQRIRPSYRRNTHPKSHAAHVTTASLLRDLPRNSRLPGLGYSTSIQIIRTLRRRAKTHLSSILSRASVELRPASCKPARNIQRAVGLPVTPRARAGQHAARIIARTGLLDGRVLDTG